MNEKFLEELKNRFEAFVEIEERLRGLGIEFLGETIKIGNIKCDVSMNRPCEIVIIARRYIDSFLERSIFCGAISKIEDEISCEADDLLSDFLDGDMETGDFVTRMNEVIKKWNSL